MDTPSWIKLQRSLFKQYKISSKNYEKVYYIGELLSSIKKIKDVNFARQMCGIVLMNGVD